MNTVGGYLCSCGVGFMRTFGAEDRPLRRLSLGDGRDLLVTDEHPFYVGGEWVRAADLVTGIELLSSAGGDVSPVTLVEHVEQERRDTVYNIEVEGHHNFFAEGVLVHNKSPIWDGDMFGSDGDLDGLYMCPPEDIRLSEYCDCDDTDPTITDECRRDAGSDGGSEAGTDASPDAE